MKKYKILLKMDFRKKHYYYQFQEEF